MWRVAVRMISGGLDKAQLAALKKVIKEQELTPAKRSRLLKRLARHGIIAAAKRNQRKQQSPDGTPWPARKRGKKKMLQNLPKLLAVREMPGGDAVTLFLRSTKSGKTISAGALGHVHASGATIRVNAENLRQRPQSGEPATKWQAKRLRALGFMRREGKRQVRASLSWIVANLHRGQAGVIIREMSGKTPARTWTIEVPARVFLGVSDDEFNNMLARQLQALNFGGQ